MDEEMIIMPIPKSKFYAVCALLGSFAAGAAVGATLRGSTSDQASEKEAPGKSNSTTDQSGASSDNTDLSTGSADQESDGTSAGDAEVDAGGHPWSPDLHASTKGKTKDGFWRMKVGVSRPDPLPGFPKDDAAGDTGTSTATDTTSATSQDATAPAPAPSDTSTAPAAGEDDEFAAFRAAAANSDATDQAAAAAVPARQYSDADLGALCNQAAVKLGDPSPIKELIAQYVPEGTVAHSRNIPEDKRAAFVGQVESKAGISFAG